MKTTPCPPCPMLANPLNGDRLSKLDKAYKNNYNEGLIQINGRNPKTLSIEKIIVKNYKSLKDTTIKFEEHLNIVVGNNESGKSTLLEAINLALTAQLNGRNIQSELHPFLFNVDAIKEYTQNPNSELPKIIIEVYFRNSDNPVFTELKGINNSTRQDSSGVVLSIEFNEDYRKDFNLYQEQKSINLDNFPVEYYKVVWRSFSGESITFRSQPLKCHLIDTHTAKHHLTSNKWVLNTIEENHKRDLSLAYRKIRSHFTQEESCQTVNTHLEESLPSIFSDKDKSKKLSIALDTSTKWEQALSPYLGEIPFNLAGQGEQNSVRIKLAMFLKEKANVFLIEEPENHLSHSKLNQLVSDISAKENEKQIIISTHSSFVLNKLGLNNLILFSKGESIRFTDLSEDTLNYFKKLPNFDTLRLILCDQCILVEGPSDELIVQKAYFIKNSKLPLQDGVDVISVKGLSFKRFLDIARLLTKVKVAVVTDNDGNIEKNIEKKYKDYKKCPNIEIFNGEDENYKTLEPQLVQANSLDNLNKALGTTFENEEELIIYMIKKENKTECALKLFETKEAFNIPDYIDKAIDWIKNP